MLTKQKSSHTHRLSYHQKFTVFSAPGYVGQLEPVELGVPDVLNLPAEELQEGESLAYELSAL